TCPDEVTRVSGRAKNARNASEWPSSNSTLGESLFEGEDGVSDDFVRGFLVAAILSQSNQRICSRQPRRLRPGGAQSPSGKCATKLRSRRARWHGCSKEKEKEKESPETRTFSQKIGLRLKR